jgi:hypothetical protein
LYDRWSAKAKVGGQWSVQPGLPSGVRPNRPSVLPLPPQYVVYASLVLILWYEPLVTFSPSATWPISAFLGFPGFPTGSVGVAACIVMIQSAVSPLAPLVALL